MIELFVLVHAAVISAQTLERSRHTLLRPQQRRQRPSRRLQCAADEPIFWTDAAQCRQRREAGQGACVRGDLDLALQDTAVPRCGQDGDAFTYFNRTMTLRCLERAASRRGESYPGARLDAYRILFTAAEQGEIGFDSFVLDVEAFMAERGGGEGGGDGQRGAVTADSTLSLEDALSYLRAEQ